MIGSLCYTLRHVPTGNDILAVVTGYRVHDWGGNDRKQKSDCEKCIPSHVSNMVRLSFSQVNRK
jgi:hypothetical protein